MASTRAMDGDRSGVSQDCRRFAVIATQRTGSTLLVRSLDAAPDIFCAGEIFRTAPRIHHGEYSYRQALAGSMLLGKAVDFAFGRRRVSAHLERFYAAAGIGMRAVGFKVMASQLRRFRHINTALRKLGVTLLFLHRRDTFATALSYCRARASGIFHSDRIAGAVSAEPTAVDTAKFREMLVHCEREKADLLALHAACGGSLFAYEDMADSWPSFVSSVGVALGIDNLQLTAVLDKLDSADPRHTVANEAELRRLFGSRGND